jgi:hypothetical protein
MDHDSNNLEDDPQVGIELREQFEWLVDLLEDLRARGWSSAYRDFLEVRFLLNGAQFLGMVEQGNDRVSNCVFCTTTGNHYILTLSMFTDLVPLGYKSNTWRNKLSMYFKLKRLHLYSQHIDSPPFHIQTHNATWTVVSQWMQQELLPVNWATTRFTTSELRDILPAMLEEANHCTCTFCQSFFPVQFQALMHLKRGYGIRRGRRSIGTDISCTTSPSLLEN